MSDGTRERILAAALDLFSARGFSAVRTKAIAEAAGVNEVTVFRLFSSKRNLYREVYRCYSIPADDESIRSIVEGEDEIDLGALARAIANLVLRNGKLVRMSIKNIAMFEDIDRDLKRQPELLTAQVTSCFEQQRKAGFFEGECASAARTFVDAVFSTTIHFLNIGAGDAALDDFLLTFSSIFAAGVRRR
jgi:AcrR family transcriptional regulator